VVGAEARVLITCEHGGCRVPRAYRPLFKAKDRLLGSHRGWDLGALLVARQLARALDAPLLAATTTRLLVDLNRSPHNPWVFSELTRGLPHEVRDAILMRHHHPHWNRVRAAVADQPPTIHLAVHSFTPVWKGEARRFTIGILYDPKRSRERILADRWKRRLTLDLPPSQVRRNAPYRGDADGLTTALRRDHAGNRYLGLELELNQSALASPSQRRRLTASLLDTFREVREGFTIR
jgi:predicted N-formylglutamate amidohydrolase